MTSKPVAYLAWIAKAVAGFVAVVAMYLAVWALEEYTTVTLPDGVDTLAAAVAAGVAVWVVRNGPKPTG